MSAMDELPRADAAPWAVRGSMFSQPGLAGPVTWATPQDLDRLRARNAPGRLGQALPTGSGSIAAVGMSLLARLLAYGDRHRKLIG